MSQLINGQPQKLGTDIRIGTFKGREGAVTDNAIMIPITNVYLFYYYYETGITPSTEHRDLTENIGYLSAVIDANTGIIIDINLNVLYDDQYEFENCFKDFE